MASISGQRPKSWVRNLYTKTGLPDNYTPDDCFLAAIQRNKNVHRYTFAQCLVVACQVNLQLCAVLLFALAYSCLDEGWVGPWQVSTVSAILTLIGYLAATELNPRLSDTKPVGIFLALGFGLAPVLYKLTDTISTDTIHTTSSVMLFLHLLFHNYNSCGGMAAYSSNPLSLNAALFAAVCLASRLDSSSDAFALLAVSVSAFALFPIFRTGLQGNHAVLVAVFVSAVVISLALVVSAGFAFASGFSLLFVTVVSPWLFVHWQSYKDTIHGPWDEAVPKIG
jgi:phosphatidylinositol glycan class C protein